MDKRGSYMYGIMLYLILGILVLVISLSFIFDEYWTGSGGEREVCWQSVQLRALLPDFGNNLATAISLKDQHPLRCKTNVVEIDKGDLKDKAEGARKKIAEAVVDCWALFGNGDYNAFPAGYFGSASTCVACSRIHLTDDAKAELGSGSINIKAALNDRMREDFSYYSYLDNSGDRFSAFKFGNNVSFNLSGNQFEVGEERAMNVYDSAKVRVDSKSGELEVVFDSPLGDMVVFIDEISSMTGIDSEVKRVILGIEDAVLVTGVDYGDSVFCEGKIDTIRCEVIEDYVDSIDFAKMKASGDEDWFVDIWVASEDATSGKVSLINDLNKVEIKVNMATQKIRLPEKMFADRGDLIISYGVSVLHEDNFGDHVPYLFYFQDGQNNDPYTEVKHDFLKDGFWSYWVQKSKEGVNELVLREKAVADDSSFCAKWDGIPA